MKNFPEVNDYLKSTKLLDKAFYKNAKTYWKVVKVDFWGPEELSIENHGTLVLQLIAFEGKMPYLEIGNVEHFALVNWEEYFTIGETPER